MNETTTLEAAQSFVDQNLFDLCSDWSTRSYTGILHRDAVFFRLVNLCAFAGSHRMALAESLIASAAIKMVSGGKK